MSTTNSRWKRNREARRRKFGHMPRLRHSTPGEAFDWNKSQVLHWLANNEKALHMVFDLLSQSKAIVFDAETGEWKGCDTP